MNYNTFAPNPFQPDSLILMSTPALITIVILPLVLVVLIASYRQSAIRQATQLILTQLEMIYVPYRLRTLMLLIILPFIVVIAYLVRLGNLWIALRNYCCPRMDYQAQVDQLESQVADLQSTVSLLQQTVIILKEKRSNILAETVSHVSHLESFEPRTSI